MKNRTLRTFHLIAAAAMLLAFASCGSKTQTYASADGSITATLNERTGEWHLTGPDGREIVPNYDSMRVTEVSPYSTMQLRSEGDIVGGKREGRWVFYHANGNIQTEATFVGGLEEGPYRVFRENGVPYYIGSYHEGVRTGKWEIYDEMGQLVTTQEY